MNKTSEQLVSELSEKLGTTAEHLWGVLVAQAPIEASLFAGFALLMIAGLYFSLKYVEKKTVINEEWDSDFSFIAWVLLSIYGLVTLLFSIDAISTIITVIFNPEFWALQQILQAANQ